MWQLFVAGWLFVGAIMGLIIGYAYRQPKPVNQNEISANKMNIVETVSPIAVEPISPRVLLMTMMGSMREGVIVIGQEMRVIASNQAVEQIFSHVKPPFEGKRLTELTRNLSVHQAFQSALEGGSRDEVKVETRDEDKRIFDLRVAPLAFENERETPSAIGIFFEITQLERLEKVRQEFLSNVSHELRTPLTSILAYVETLEDGAIDDTENNVKFLGVIRRNAERMRHLINDILELSAIEAGKVTVEPRPVRLKSLIDDVTTNLSAKADPRRIRMRNEIPSNVMIFADAARLEQMLTNLMDNAVKFNREGGEVIIKHERRERDKIHITDTGEGITPEHLERIFERFYRVDKARSRDIGGTGLGLAIVKHLARLHGGEVSARSTLNEGSTFTIELPINN